jgi:hypothetical protein
MASSPRCVVSHSVLFVFHSVLFSVTAVALAAQAPLPSALREAKTAFLSLEAGDMRAMDDLAKHWRQTLPGVALVEKATEADIVVTVQRGPSGKGYGYLAGPLFGESGTQAWRLLIRSRDGTFAEPLYSDSEVIGDFAEYGGIRNLVRRLRTRLAPGK